MFTLDSGSWLYCCTYSSLLPNGLQKCGFGEQGQPIKTGLEMMVNILLGNIQFLSQVLEKVRAHKQNGKKKHVSVDSQLEHS